MNNEHLKTFELNRDEIALIGMMLQQFNEHLVLNPYDPVTHYQEYSHAKRLRQTVDALIEKLDPAEASIDDDDWEIEFDSPQDQAAFED